MQPNYLPKVREQYEALPYPPYDPAQDKIQLVTTWFDRLDYLNHRFFDGRHRFGKGFRVLCAGDGTGHGSIFLAEQLSDLGGEVVALDLSSASQAIAKERATMRKLTNITHINASLLDIPKLHLGEFDFISCSGVLHHLADPDEGLRALAGALKPTGVMGIMVYATIGRTSVYYLQDMLRRLFGKDTPMDEQLDITRSILADLPRSNWFWFNNTAFMNDVTLYGDSGIFDLLLHTQDRAYTASECYDWTRRCGLRLAEFTPTSSHEEVRYNPCYFIKDEAFCARVRTLPKEQQHTIAELLTGNIIMHNFYAMKGEPPTELSGDDASLIPSWGVISPISPAEAPFVAQMVRNASGQKQVAITIPNCPVKPVFTRHDTTADIILAIDGERTISEVLDTISTQYPSLPRAAIETQWKIFYAEARLNQCIVLRRHEGVSFPSCLDMQKRSAARMKNG